MQPRRRRGLLPALLALGVLASGCTVAAPPVQQTSETVPTTAPAADTGRVTVAIDDLGQGFNPHLLADLSPVATAVSDLVLPSVFHPASDGTPRLDTSVAVSARVTATAPFTVTYVLRNAAQWSDGAPIAAEDFRYLWEQMTTQPGVVDPAGYQLVDDVSSSAGGKTVTVRFSAAYPAWQQLFAGLLPSHVLKDAPGGFTGALDDAITFSGSRYAVASVDTDRGEILLQRNDRFWDRPPALDEILLRRSSSAAQTAESLRTDDAQLAIVSADPASTAQLRAVPGLSTQVLPLASAVQVAVRTTSPSLTSAPARRGVLGLLDRDVLTTIGTGGARSALVDRAQLLAPSQPGYTDTELPRPTVVQARELLAQGGYRYSDGRYLDGSTPLVLVVGSDERDPAAAAVAQAAADELVVAGVTATATPMPADELYSSTGGPDLVVGRVAVGGDLATSMTSRFACAPGVAGSAVTSGSPAPSTGTPGPGGTPAPTSSGTATAGGNVSGLCDPAVQEPLRAALTGTRDASEVAAELEPLLWAQGAVLPLYQESALLSVRSTLQGVDTAPDLTEGPLADAAGWTRDRP